MMHQATRILSFVLLIVLALTAGAVFTGAPVSASRDTGGADPEAGRAAGYYATIASQERELERLAVQHDPRYAGLKTAHQAAVDAFLEKAHETGAVFGEEGEILDPVPVDLLPLLQRANKLTARLEQSKGYKFRVAEEARRAVESMKDVKTSTTTKSYSICIYRDPSAGGTSQTDLTNLVNAAMGRIKAGVESHSGGAYSIQWTTEWHGSYDLSGCSPSVPGGSGTTYYIYFRRNEHIRNGWGACKSWAVVDLYPTGGCSWSWNWPDSAATAHELGHVFGASHGDYGSCGEYNDKDCSAYGCGYQSCDSSTYCVEEYADAGRGRTTSFCWNDSGYLCNFVEFGTCGPGN
ncbi:MAG: hypothetical protein HYX75_08005 [Acidobacteria bacterium]|nr:hypothetical protein [Acidobacteriota bacterium]